MAENPWVPPQKHLPRLPPSAYEGRAIVHWTLTLEERAQGWLNADFHRRLRWILLHGCARHETACPAYCLMPDHVHLLMVGWTKQGDQIRLMKFLRRHTNELLKTTEATWQKQAYDHVLRPQESDRYAFEALAHYIAENPVRAGLVKTRHEWLYSGALIPGYPELAFSAPDYWTRYWRIVASRNGL